MSSTLKARLQTDLNQARKDRDRLRTVVLSTTLSEIRNREIDQGGELEDDDVLQVIGKAIKQRKDAADQMRGGGREELAAKEEREADILTAYLPEQLDEAEVRARIRALIAEGVTEMGPLMGRLMPELRGRFDGKEANRLVREEMAG